MRLIRLKLEAFGPYLNEELIDFRALRYSNLFLIHGPVGSGKTFILDGICFALYGRSSGGERQREGLRNLSADPGKETLVALDFQAGSQNYRVERRFGSLKEQNDGDAEDAVLYRLPEIGEPNRRDILSSSLSGVSSMVTKLLGLTAEQFCQVAILPQGRFRRFLLAEVEERREILSNIFGADRHLRFQETLAEARQEAKQELDAAWKSREELVASYSDAGGDPRESLLRSTEELKTVDRDCQGHQERSVEWEKSLEETVRYEILERQCDTSERELSALTHQGDNPEEFLVEKLKRAVPHYLDWKRLVEEAEVISAELHQQRQQYEKLKSGGNNYLEAEVERARRLEEERFSIQRSLERLTQLAEDFQGVEFLREEVERSQEKLEELKERRNTLAASVKQDMKRVEELEVEIDKVEQAAAKVKEIKGQLKLVSDQQEKTRQSVMLGEAYQQQLQRVTRLEEIVDALKDEQAGIKEAIKVQKDRDFTGVLQQLKKTLKEGEECPLCGSLDHPSPFSGRKARSAGEADEEALKSVKNKLKMAESELSQARDRAGRLAGRLEERGFVKEEPPLLDEATVRKLRQTVQAVEERVSGKEELKRELRELKESLKPNKGVLKKMRLLRERIGATIETTEAQRQAREKTLIALTSEFLPQAAGVDYEKTLRLLKEERERLQERLEEIEQVEYSTERAELMAETFALQLAEARASEKKREQLLDAAAEKKNLLKDQFRLEFSSWDDLSFALGRAARDNSRQQGQEAVLDRETLIKTIERQLSQSQELLASLPEPEMRAEQIRHALAREREQLELKVTRRVVLEKSVERAREDVGRYDALVETIRSLESKHQTIEFLAKLSEKDAGGFHEWYLREVFSRVVAAANLRLEILAPNRFCLGLREGLEVGVVDFLAGKERLATTLSGGESFLASLALALGLGDVLQGDRQSRDRLQTLFIDEGFGYLDRRALEAALDCLESLKQEGRTVGIISHVNALRDRVRAQIVVAPNDSPLPYGVDRVQVFTE